jgi:dTMP kinase
MFESFLTVEGADGVGKSTQVQLLSERLRKHNREVHLLDFPSKYGSPIGDLIGSFLTERHEGVTPEFLSLAFAIDRRSVLKGLENRKSLSPIFLSDRFVLSNIAFQCSKISDPERKQKLEELINWVEYVVLGLPRPTLEIVLVAPDSYFQEGIHLHRAGSLDREYAQGQADVHERQTGLQRSVNAFYSSLEDTKALRKLNICSPSGERKTAEELHSEVWQQLSNMVQSLGLHGGSNDHDS